MPLLFSYGTLQQENVQRTTFGRVLEGRKDELVGFELSSITIRDPQVVATSGKTEHTIVRFNGRNASRAAGTVFEITDKWRAAEWNGDASRIGVYASSSGGHVAELLAMRPHDARYSAIPLPAAPNRDVTVAYVATRSPVSDPYARFRQAERMKREGMIENSKIYFNPWGTIHEGNPQQILERREPVTLVPMLIMQGALDDNVLPALQEKFAATYRAAGGVCELTVFEDSEHEWVAKPGPQTDRAREMVKAFIARQLQA